MNTYGYDTYGSYGSSGLETGLAFAGALLVIVIIIGIAAAVLAVLGFIGQWKAFKKAGKRGWEALIAGHNQFVNCEFVGVNPIWVLFLLFGSVVCIIPILGSFLYFALFCYYQVLVGISTAKAFGKGTGFGIGLAIPVSAPIFWFILGGKDVQYVGPNPMEDFVLGFFDKNKANNSQATPNMNMNQGMNNGGFQQPQSVVNPTIQPMNNMMNTNPSTQPTKFCTSCGYKVTNGERFCPGCGKEM